MNFSWDTFPRPIVALAPMAGYTDSAYRLIVKSLPWTENVVCFSELTSVDAIHHQSREAYRMMDWDPGERPLIMQLFGKTPGLFVEAGKRLEGMGVAGIDINMGCPTCKITSNECGSALLRNPSLAAEIVYSLSRAVSVPVSVKTRLGYECYDEAKFLAFCSGVVDAGAKMLTLHGRTRLQAFSGEADWSPLYFAKRALRVPVIGNGDIRSVEDAVARLGDLDGVMIGRATVGNPWLVAAIAARFAEGEYIVPGDGMEAMLVKLPLVRRHFELAVASFGERRACNEMRKHFAAYIGGFPGARAYADRFMRCVSSESVVMVLDELERFLRSGVRHAAVLA